MTVAVAAAAVPLSCMERAVGVEALDELLRASEVVRQNAFGVVLDMRADGDGVNLDVSVRHCAGRYL